MVSKKNKSYTISPKMMKLVIVLGTVFFVVQILFPVFSMLQYMSQEIYDSTQVFQNNLSWMLGAAVVPISLVLIPYLFAHSVKNRLHRWFEAYVWAFIGGLVYVMYSMFPGFVFSALFPIMQDFIVWSQLVLFVPFIILYTIGLYIFQAKFRAS